MNIFNLNTKYRLLYLIFFIVIFLGFFTNPYHHDEGLIEIILSNYSEKGVFNFALVDIELTFIRSYLYLLSCMPGELIIPNNYLILRIPNLIIGFLCIIIFIKILSLLYTNLNWTAYPSIIIFTYYLLNFSGGMTIRPDIWIFFNVMVSIYGYIKFQEKNNLYYILFPFLLSGLLVSIHHLMIFPLFINFVLIIKNSKLFNSKLIFKSLCLSLIIALISLYILLWGDTVSDFLINLDSANDNFDGSMYRNIQSEFFLLERLRHLYYYYPRFTLVLLPLTFLIFISFVYKKIICNREYVAYYYFFIIGFILLSMIPDKWLHHYSMLLPIVILLSIDSLKIIESNFKYNQYFILRLTRYSIIIYCMFSFLFLVTDVYRNIYYNNYLQMNLKSISNYIPINFILNEKIIDSNKKLTILNQSSREKYYLMEPSIYPMLRNSNFSKKQFYENEELADLIFINIFKQNECNDNDKYEYPNEFFKNIRFSSDNRISFNRYTYLICKIK